MQDKFGVAETTAHSRQKLLGRIQDPLINLALDNLLHVGVLDHFPCNASVATSYDQYSLRARVTAQRQERDHFLVGKLVKFCALDYSVKDESTTVVLAAKNLVYFFYYLRRSLLISLRF